MPAMQIDEYVTASEARQDLPKILKKVKDLHRIIAITQKGKPTGILISLDEFEGLLETLEIMGDPKAMEVLRRYRTLGEKGFEWKTYEEVFEE
jgi:prevent-host-death family protein